MLKLFRPEARERGGEALESHAVVETEVISNPTIKF
jgi:hypothetical protein